MNVLLWHYLSETQKQLANDGRLLLEDRDRHPNEYLSDYSYLVFPFAKLYEGFLKHLFLDLGIITRRDYDSTHFRVGKVLSPNIMRRLGSRSAYGQISHRYGLPIANLLWSTWKQGRNLIFHYFPHNVSRLTLHEATEIIDKIFDAMEQVIVATNPEKQQ